MQSPHLPGQPSFSYIFVIPVQCLLVGLIRLLIPRLLNHDLLVGIRRLFLSLDPSLIVERRPQAAFRSPREQVTGKVVKRRPVLDSRACRLVHMQERRIRLDAGNGGALLGSVMCSRRVNGLTSYHTQSVYSVKDERQTDLPRC